MAAYVCSEPSPHHTHVPLLQTLLLEEQSRGSTKICVHGATEKDHEGNRIILTTFPTSVWRQFNARAAVCFIMGPIQGKGTKVSAPDGYICGLYTISDDYYHTLEKASSKLNSSKRFQALTAAPATLEAEGMERLASMYRSTSVWTTIANGVRSVGQYFYR